MVPAAKHSTQRLDFVPGYNGDTLPMRLKAVAAAAQVNEQTIRFYERVGVLRPPARMPNGHREYAEDTVALVRFIKRAQELGFSLADARILSELRHPPSRSCAKARTLAESQLDDVERRIADLQAISATLRQLIQTCCQTPSLGCPILEALDGSVPLAERPSGGRQADEVRPPERR